MNVEECAKSVCCPAPLYDTEGRFIFYPVAKTGHSSINRHVLKNRTIVKKDNFYQWQKVSESFNKKNDFFAFTLVRNPYARTLSSFLYLRDKLFLIHSKTSFEDWIVNLKLPLPISSEEYLRARDEVNFDKNAHTFPQVSSFYGTRVDFFAHTESIQKDFDYIFKKIKEPRHIIPHVNKTNKNKKWRDYYTNKAIDAVKDKYSCDFEALGYSYDIQQAKSNRKYKL